jgi:predicted TIM-barrel fold metal-dependent hydrolase
MLAEVDWLADHGYVAVSFPGHTIYLHEPAVFDRHWDPFWAKVQERGLLLLMHAGHGEQQGEHGRDLARICRGLKAKGEDFNNLVGRVKADIFDDGAAFASVKPRRAMWQLMMGGVFDRFPKLKLVVSEIHADWLPATLRLLDDAFEMHRDTLPGKRKPSEYWADNCLNGVSFLRKCEVEQRHEIGLKTLAFGRDYPHTEGTWPNTKQWLREIFDGMPPDEIKAIAGENAIRFMGLNRAKLAEIAERIHAPTVAEIASLPPASASLRSHFHERGTHFLDQSEGASRVPEMKGLLQNDLWQIGAPARVAS